MDFVCIVLVYGWWLVSCHTMHSERRQIEGKKSSPHLDGGVALYPLERGLLCHLRMPDADPRQRRRLWRRRCHGTSLSHSIPFSHSHSKLFASVRSSLLVLRADYCLPSFLPPTFLRPIYVLATVIASLQLVHLRVSRLFLYPSLPPSLTPRFSSSSSARSTLASSAT